MDNDLGGIMALVRIMNDNCIHFYVELKRKEPSLMAYALCVVATKSLSAAGADSY